MSAGLGPFYLKFAAEVRIVYHPRRGTMMATWRTGVICPREPGRCGAMLRAVADVPS